MHHGERKTSQRERPLSSSRTRALTAMALLAAVAVGGCGGGSDDDALTEFEGTWRVTPDPTRASDYRLSCPSLMFDDQFPLFTDVILDRGTVTDMYESAAPGNCQFGFNTVPKMKALSIANPNPFTVMAPSCLIDLGQAGTNPMTNGRVNTQFVITPVSWLFNLVAPVKGLPPRAQFIVHAIIAVDNVDVDAVPPTRLDTSACTYDIKENLDKVSRQ